MASQRARGNLIALASLLAAIAFTAAFSSPHQTPRETPVESVSLLPSPALTAELPRPVNQPELHAAASSLAGAHQPDSFLMVQEQKNAYALVLLVTRDGGFGQWQLFRRQTGKPWKMLGRCPIDTFEKVVPDEAGQKQLGVPSLPRGVWQLLCQGRRRSFNKL